MEKFWNIMGVIVSILAGLWYGYLAVGVYVYELETTRDWTIFALSIGGFFFMLGVALHYIKNLRDGR